MRCFCTESKSINNIAKQKALFYIGSFNIQPLSRFNFFYCKLSATLQNLDFLGCKFNNESFIVRDCALSKFFIVSKLYPRAKPIKERLRVVEILSFLKFPAFCHALCR